MVVLAICKARFGAILFLLSSAGGLLLDVFLCLVVPATSQTLPRAQLITLVFVQAVIASSVSISFRNSFASLPRYSVGNGNPVGTEIFEGRTTKLVTAAKGGSDKDGTDIEVPKGVWR